MEELDKLLVGDLEPVIADLPTVPKDDIKDIDDQLPDVPTRVPIIIYYYKHHHRCLFLFCRNLKSRQRLSLLLPWQQVKIYKRALWHGCI